MKNLQNIDTFLLLSELGQFNKVAKRLNLSVTAISKQISNLEDRLGEDLFIRTTRKVQLTDFGESLYQHCQELSKKIDELDEFIAAKREVPCGNLVVSCSSHTGRDILMDHINEFTKLYPEITLHIRFSEVVDSSDNLNADIYFAFAAHHGQHNDMRCKKLFTINHLLCASPQYLQEHGPIHTIEDLSSQQFINFEVRKPIDEIRQANSKAIKTPHPYIIMNRYDELNQLCLDGCGLFLSTNYHAKSHLEAGELVAVLPDLDYCPMDICIFYRMMKYELPKVRAFIDFFAEKTKMTVTI